MLERTVPKEGVQTPYLPYIRVLAEELPGAEPFLRAAFCLEIFRERGLVSLARSGDDLTLRLTRGDRKISLEESAYLQTLQSSHQTRNGKEFCLEKESGTVNYSRAVVKTDSGTTIIYDATDASSQQAVWLAMYFGALLVAVVTGLIITMKRLRQARK